MPVDVRVKKTSNPDDALLKQTLPYSTFASMASKDDRAKISFERIIVKTASEAQHECNETAYRLFRACDDHGKVVNVKLWGSLAEETTLFNAQNILRIQQAILSKSDRRSEIRSSSSATFVKPLKTEDMSKKFSYVTF